MVIGVSVVVGTCVVGACYVGYKVVSCAIDEFSEFFDYLIDDDDDDSNG